MKKINETDLKSKDECCDINYNNIFTFEEISSPKNLILPSLYNEISLSNTDISDSEIQNFHNILTEKHPNYQIITLIAPFLQINKNLIPNILCKFWARCYTFESSFYRVMNNSLMKGEWDNYNIFIKMMYKGIKLKSLTSSFNKKFYRGQLISKVEYDNIYNSINNNNKQLIYSRCFLSFSTDESVAHSFLNESHKDNIVSILLVINSSVNNETYTSNTDVKEFSFFEGEEEVLFFPYSSFVAESIEDVDYYKQINLSYLGVYKNEIKEEYKNIKDINEFLNKMQNDKFFKDIGGIKNKNKDGNLENMKEYFKKEIKKIIEKKKEEIEKEENLKINVEYNGTISSLYVPPYKKVKYLKELIKKTHPKNFDVDRLIYQRKNISQNEELVLGEIFKNKLSINVKIVERKQHIKNSISMDIESKIIDPPINLTKEEEKYFKCKCNQNLVNSYCRNCKKLLCNSCRINEIHKVVQINLNNLSESCNLYSLVLQKDISNKIKKENYKKFKFNKKKINEYSSKYENIQNKYDEVYKKYDEALKVIDIDSQNNEIYEKKLNEYKEKTNNINNDLDNLSNNIYKDYFFEKKRMKNETFNEILKKISEKDDELEDNSKDINNYIIYNKITENLNKMNDEIEKSLDNILNSKTFFDIDDETNLIFEKLKNNKNKNINSNL